MRGEKPHDCSSEPHDGRRKQKKWSVRWNVGMWMKIGLVMRINIYFACPEIFII